MSPEYPGYSRFFGDMWIASDAGDDPGQSASERKEAEVLKFTDWLISQEYLDPAG